MLHQATLRTAQELYQYSCDHKLGTGFGRSWGIRNFRLIEKRLQPGEAAFLTFVGLHRFRSMSYHQRNFAYAITNRRILMGQVRSFGRIRFESVPLNKILNLSFDSDNTIGIMKIMLDGDAVTIGMNQEVTRALAGELTELLPQIQELAQQMENESGQDA